jgi:hypothetical protein
MTAAKLFLAIACAAGLVASSFTQNPATIQATTPTTGTFIFTFTITLGESIPGSDKIGCTANANFIEKASENQIAESAGQLATRSGSTATCIVTMPYSWNLATPGSDKVNLSYVIETPVETGGNALLRLRSSRQTIGTIAVPPNGSTTNETITTTI